MKVLITGATGLLGRALMREFSGDEITAVSKNGGDGVKAVDLTRPADVAALFVSRFDLVVHSAALADVDACERDPEAAHAANALAVKNVAEHCARQKTAFIYVSTDYVFDGTKREPYVETDTVFPVNAYGLSKLAGEYHARLAPVSCIVRTSWLFGEGSKVNFVNALIERLKKGGTVKVLDDQTDSPTYAKDLAAALKTAGVRLVSSEARTGIAETFHVCNSGATTRLGMALKIKEAFRLDGVHVERLDKSEISGRLAIRPAYGVLSTRHFETFFGHPLRNWEDSLVEYAGNFFK